MTKIEESARAAKIAAVKGMNDILPAESAQWEWFEENVRQTMAAYAYRNIRTPIVEHTKLFVKGTGESTDIVEKEMYSFVDRLNGEELTLRPENTPGVVRAAIEHNLVYDGPKRLFYMGPMFRHERPQRGRYRQFYQLGVEALGFSGPELDAEQILLASHLLSKLGVRNVRVELNSLGVGEERQAHRNALVDYFSRHPDALDEDSKRRLISNPLRILDTKNPAMQQLVEAAPRLIEYLGESSRKHFESVQTALTACGVKWSVNPRLVRGLDYYNHTVFEFVTDELGSQGTLCGGGRYDGLFELLGAKATPAVGWGMGIERVLELIRVQSTAVKPESADVYAILPDSTVVPIALKTISSLREAGVRVQMHGAIGDGLGSIKSQFKKADASGAMFALIFGSDEVSNGMVAVKNLRDNQSEQVLQTLADPQAWAHSLQSKA